MIRPLTSLRFFAALLVFVYHAPLTTGFGKSYGLGPAGVGFFFVLSGFILTRTYGHAFSALDLTGLRTFYLARFARIYPVHLVGVGVMLLVVLTLGGPHWDGFDRHSHVAAILASVTLTQSWFPSIVVFGVNPPAWSLSDEAVFYAAFPFVVRAFHRSARWKLLAFAATAWLSLTVAVARLDVPSFSWPLYALPTTRLIDFLVGVLLALALRSLTLPGSRATSIEAVALVLAFLGIALTPLVPNSLRAAAFLMPVWAAVVVVFAFQQGAISRVLSSDRLVRLGEASFAFYVLHFAVIEITKHLPGISDLLRFGIALAVSLALALLVYRFLEEPARRGLRRALSTGPFLPARLRRRAV